MNHAPHLTIAIPTYNRNELLRTNALVLFEQLGPGVQVLIIDNASPLEVSTSMGPLPPGVTLVRNPVNVGGNENILRCMESCETPWVMVMGDDDCPLPGMVARILADIATYPKATILNYATANMHRRSRGWQTRGRLEFLESLDSFDNMLFISSSVFHVGRLRPSFQWAHHYAYSCAPHLALLLASMDESAVAVFRTDSLVNWTLPEVEYRGSKFTMALGLPTLLELPLQAREKGLLAAHLARFNSGGELLHEALLATLFGGKTRREALRLYLGALNRLPFLHAPLRRLWGWYISPLIFVPGLSYRLVGRIAQSIIGRPMGPGNLRSDHL